MAEPVHLTSPDALKDLADIVVPAPVSWSPQAWGWWVLAGVLLAVAVLLAIRQVRRSLANRYRREALKECAGLVDRLDSEPQRAEALSQLAELLKRTALTAWPRNEVAALSGRDWIEFLRRHAGTAAIDERMERLLDDAEYRPASLAAFSGPDAHACAQAVEDWIESHRVPA